MAKKRKLGAHAAQATLPLKLFNLQCSTTGRAPARRALEDYYEGALPAVLRERKFTPPAYDKAFACEWQDAETVVVGTKCNSLLRLHLPSATFEPVALPPAPARAFSTENEGWGACGIHTVTSNPARDLLATGGADPADCQILRTADWSPVQTLMGHRDWLFGAAWVTDRHLVTGSRDGSVALWNVDAEPGAPGSQLYDYHNPRQMKRRFGGKVREVRYRPALGLVAALDTDGAIKMMDPAADLRTVRTLATGPMQELVAMAMGDDLVAVGGLSAALLLDPRVRGVDAVVAALQSPDGNHGVRSVCVTDRVVSFGSGQGKISLYDVRAARYLPTVPPPGEAAPRRAWGEAEDDALPPSAVPFCEVPRSRHAEPPGYGSDPPPALGAPLPAAGRARVVPPSRHHLQASNALGWVAHNETYYEYFAESGVEHAVYTHAWDPSGTRLFVGGGPLAFGLRGGYLALWE